jgi:hypothetical protein
MNLPKGDYTATVEWDLGPLGKVKATKALAL